MVNRRGNYAYFNVSLKTILKICTGRKLLLSLQRNREWSIMSEPKLYKYLDADGGLKMLKNCNLQFTNATQLNDPFDCHPALIDFSNVPAEACKNWSARDIERLQNNRYQRNRDKAWICSLSKVNNALLMWSYYGAHQGMCIGLDMEKANKYLSRIQCSVFQGTIEMEVQYKEIVEKPDYYSNLLEDYYRYQLSTKAIEWKHEQEVRLLLIDPIQAFVPMALPYEPKDKSKPVDWKEVRAYPRLGGECFESLYLGIKIDEDKKAEIIKTALTCNPNIMIYQMEIDPKAFKLKETQI